MSEIIEPVREVPKTSQMELGTTTPGLLKTIKRNGKVTHYDDNKIRVAITKAFIAVEGGSAAASNRIHDQVNLITRQITEAFKRRMPEGGTIHIEDIQDQVELALMRSGAHKVARSYVLYREEHRKARESELAAQAADSRVPLITMPNGKLKPLDLQRVETIVTEACRNLEGVQAEPVISDALRNLYNQAKLSDVHKALIMAARALVETEPNYSFVSARLLLDSLRAEALGHLGLREEATFDEMRDLYPVYFKAYIAHGINLGMLDPKLIDFDLDALARALVPERDMQFTYLGLQTLYDRYFIHDNGIRYELPQTMFMRVAMGLALREQAKEEQAILFYNRLSSFDYMASTPTLFNAGTVFSQLSSCYLTTVEEDSLEAIYESIKNNALLSKFAGGLGNDWTPVRAMGSPIRGTNGKSQGVVPFLNVADATAVAVNQGGKRKGAVCAYLECWHLDVEEFLELRKNTGDDRRRTHDMNTALWIPDLFMERVQQDGEWTLFSPDDVKGLHDAFGKAFSTLYTQYEEAAREGKITNCKTVSALKLWRRMLTMLFETGHPWLTFKDPCNLRSPQQHAGVVHSSNLCTEITLNTSAEEIAVCNLGSINLPAHIINGKLDHEKLHQTVTTAVRMLDNVIDINFYAVAAARNSNLRHRPVGLGIMGFQDALYKMGIDYASKEAVEFADASMELVSYYAIEASCDLARERGSYPSFEGSLWSKGILPIDSINLLQQTRGKNLEQDRTQRLDWEPLRVKVRTQGMRNSNVMAIAPTATISNICGVSQSIEPTYQNLYVKSNLSGEFTVINPYLVDELKALNLWDAVMVNDLKYYNGSVQPISRIPAHLKTRFATSFEIDPMWLVEAASRRQKWIDQAQSLNIYMAKPSGKKLDDLYKQAWLRGLKTTYYLRSLGASNAEKSTISDGALNAVKIDEPKVCSILDPDCEACQ